MIEEMKQLYHDSKPGKIVILPIEADTLTAEDKSNALDAVNIMK